MSKGIWKSVYLALDEPRGACISHVVPAITYRGEYPTHRLVDGAHAGFSVSVRIHMSAARPFQGMLSVVPGWSVGGKAAGSVAVSKEVKLPGGESNVTLQLDADADAIKLWWAAGLGEQPLYSLTVSFTPIPPAETSRVRLVETGTAVSVISTSRRIGFRYFALVCTPHPALLHA